MKFSMGVYHMEFSLATQEKMTWDKLDIHIDNEIS